MKKMLLAFPLILGASSLEIENLRTDLYSKSGVNVLKKIELSLEFEGENLDLRKSQIIDSINTVISGFFYEDIFTESGKNNFKNTLEKFIAKKYKVKIDEIYILSLSGVEKFDIEEFKKFLQSSEAKEKNTGNQLKKVLDDMEIPQAKDIKIPTVPQIPKNFFGDSEDNGENTPDTDINPEILNVPKNMSDIEEKIKRDLIQNQNSGKRTDNVLEQNRSKKNPQTLDQNFESSRPKSNSDLEPDHGGFELNHDENETSI